MSFVRTLGALTLLGPVLGSAGWAQEARRPTVSQRLFGETHRMLPRHLDAAVALGDVDGDGDLDAVIGLRLFLNDGNALLLEARDNLVVDSDGAGSLALADVDGDGALDILIGSRGRNSLLLNDGEGVFRDASDNLPDHTDNTSEIAVADFDGDGDQDLYAANWSGRGGFDRLYLNDGSGFFAYAQFNLPINVGGGITVAAGDVDGDGDVDVMTGHQGRFMHDVFGQQNRLYRNEGNGVFTDVTSRLPAVADKTNVLALADVDGDDDLDAFIGNGGNAAPGEQTSLWLNNGNGRFSDATGQLPAGPDITNAIVFGDFEDDGDQDALILNNGQNRLLSNDGLGVFTDSPGGVPTRVEKATSAAAGDLDGDGDLDAVVTGVSIQNRIFLNDGSGNLVDVTEQPRLPARSDDTRDLASGDVDGDGDVDVLAGNDVENILYVNDGMGSFSEATPAFPADARRTSAVALADVDGDGALDALTGSIRRDEHLYMNDGLGSFTDDSDRLPLLDTAAAALAFGDLDGDGDPDALVGNMLYDNGGDGFFSNVSTRLPAGFPSADDFAFGDVDDDGSLDIILGGNDNGLLLNDGNGSFADATGNIPALSEGLVNAVAVGDLEQDGDLDIVIGLNRFFGAGMVVMGPVGRDHLYLNDGDGSFVDAPGRLPDTNEVVTDIGIADVDADGDLDIAMSATGRPFSREPNRLYLNDGDGDFRDGTAEHLDLVEDRTRAVLLTDLDDDGDPDLWFGNDKLDRLYVNLSRQLAWRSFPRIGRPVSLDVLGPPTGKWLLAMALDTGRRHHPFYGVFLLDPASFEVIAHGHFDQAGRAAVEVALPPELDAAGIPLYWQTSYLLPRSFSNLEVTTLSDL